MSMTTISPISHIAAALVAVLASQTAVHASTVYHINRTVGTGTVIGTIETDGTNGVLAKENILDWDLFLNADSNPLTVGRLSGPESGNNSTLKFFPNAALTASTTGAVSTLSMNFGSASWSVFQITTADGSVVWQMQPGVPFQDELVRESGPFDPTQTDQFHGPVNAVLGTASVVPLPATGWLFLSGLGLLGMTSRSRKPKA